MTDQYLNEVMISRFSPILIMDIGSVNWMSNGSEITHDHRSVHRAWEKLNPLGGCAQRHDVV